MSVFIFYLVLILFLFLVFLRFYNRFDEIESVLLKYIQNFSEIIDKLQLSVEQMGIDYSLNSLLQPILSKAASYVSSLFASILSKIPTITLSVIVMLVTSVYFSKDLDSIKRFLLEALPENHLKTLKLIKEISVNDLFKILKGYGIMASIAFIIMLVFFFAFKIRGAVLKAFVIAIIDMLPVLGVGTVLIPWCVLCIINGNYIRSVILLVLYIVITVTRNALQPKILGKQTGIHPMITLFSLLVGLKLFGTKGLLVIPFLTTVTIHFFKEKYIIDRKFEGTA